MDFQVQINKHLLLSCLIIGALTVFGESVVPTAIAGSNLKPQILDCSSPKASINFLKAIASVSVACPENNEIFRDFWETACKCAVNRLPDSLCPKCRRSRAVEVGNDPSTKAKVSGTHFNGRLTTSLPDKQLTTPEVGSKSTTERIILPEQRLPATAQATHSASSNFIRFGK